MAVEKLDMKFYGQIFKVKNQQLVSPDQYVVFLAKDNAFANVLPLYLEECKRLGCDDEQITQTELLIRHVQEWREAHPQLCKNPDAKGERLWLAQDRQSAQRCGCDPGANWKCEQHRT